MNRNPRLQVTLDPEIYDAFRRIGFYTKRSAAGLITDMINGQRDEILLLADTVAKASRLSRPLSTSLRVVLGKNEKVAREVEIIGRDVLDRLDDEIRKELADQELKNGAA